MGGKVLIYIAYLMETFFIWWLQIGVKITETITIYQDKFVLFSPVSLAPFTLFKHFFYYSKSASVGFTTDSILLSPKPFSAKRVEITCPLEKLTNVKLEETGALLFSCSQNSSPSSCSHLVPQQAGLPNPRDFQIRDFPNPREEAFSLKVFKSCSCS